MVAAPSAGQQGGALRQLLPGGESGARWEKGPLFPWGPPDLRVAPLSLPVTTSAPIQTTSTLYERGFEKIMKKQNKEQVPPPAVEPKKPSNKKQTKKVATLTNQNQKQGRFRSLEEALRAVSAPRLWVGEGGGPECGGDKKGGGGWAADS